MFLFFMVGSWCLFPNTNRAIERTSQQITIWMENKIARVSSVAFQSVYNLLGHDIPSINYIILRSLKAKKQINKKNLRERKKKIENVLHKYICQKDANMHEVD